MNRWNRIGAVLGAMAIMVAFHSAADAAETISYSYDAQGRLATVAHSGTVNNGQLSNYSYDTTGNRTNAKTTGK